MSPTPRFYNKSKGQLVKHHKTKPPIKSLSVLKRAYGSTALDRLLINDTKKKLNLLTKQINIQINTTTQRSRVMFRHRNFLLMKLIRLRKANPKINEKPMKIVNKHRAINTWNPLVFPEYFRFRSPDQLHRLVNSFRIPRFVRCKQNREKFSGEEALLLTLYSILIKQLILCIVIFLVMVIPE